MALQESEIPAELGYVAYVEMPSKFDSLLMIIDHVVQAKRHSIVPE